MTCSEPRALDRAPQGAVCSVHHLTARGAIRQRLLDMGLMPGSTVQLVRFAPLGDPIEVRVGAGSSFVAIRRHEAGQVMVTVCGT